MQLKNQQRGITLLELLIAMALAVVIVSAVVRLLSRTITQEQHLSADIELQESLYYLHHQLENSLDNALHSPCGKPLDSLLGNDNAITSPIKRAKLRTASGLVPQALPNVVIQTIPLPAGADSATLRQTDFPLLAVGIAGHTHEIRDNEGLPLSSRLSNIVMGSEYWVVMHAAQPIGIDLPTPTGITGGPASGGALAELNSNIIPTTAMDYRVGLSPVPYLITNCRQGNLFRPSVAVKKTGIPIDNNLFFSSAYLPAESLLYPVTLYAYYVSEVDAQRSLSRVNLSLTTINHQPASQPLVGDIDNINLSWGIGSAGVLQQFFTSEQVLSSGIGMGIFRQQLLAVKATLTVKNQKTHRQKTVQRIYALRHHHEVSQ